MRRRPAYGSGKAVDPEPGDPSVGETGGPVPAPQAARSRSRFPQRTHRHRAVPDELRHRISRFGLLHGLGFAGALSFTDHFNGRLLISLLSFNLGRTGGSS